jgi:hypothetical protein
MAWLIIILQTAVVALMVSLPCAAATIWSASLALEGRVYESPAQYVGQAGDTFSIRAKARYVHDWNNGRDVLTVSPTFSSDSADSRRDRLDMDELGWTHLMDNAELRLGWRKVFWGVAESNHLVDIINQTNLAENLNGESKLAQPMINIALFSNYGTLDIFALPGFRERTFPGTRGRFRGPLAVDVGAARYEASECNKHVDFAVRWSVGLGQLDIGVSHFHGTSREPTLLNGTARPVPYYPQIAQNALDLQLTADALIWKLEAIRRTGNLQSFYAAVGGIEYTFYGVLQDRTDVGVFLEYSHDTRGTSAAFGMDDDVFMGLRLVLNDSDATEAMLGMVNDLNGDGRSLLIEASRRMGENWKLYMEGRWMRSINRSDAIYPARFDSYIQVGAEFYF